MSGAFQDLDEVIPLTSKQLPIRGQLVTFPDRISAKTGMLLLRIQQRHRENPTQDGAELVDGLVDEESTERLMVEVFGRPWEEMLQLVGGDAGRVLHVFQTLTAWHLAGEDAARELWNDPGKLRALAATKTTTGPSKGKAKSGRRGSRASSPTSASPARKAPGGASSSPTGA